jgi:glucose-6-phosphate 1-dehydrogenase
VSGEEAEQAWRIVDPVLQAWAQDAVPMLEYPAGAAGPAPLDEIARPSRE